MKWEEVRGAALQVGAKVQKKWPAMTEADMGLLRGGRDAFLARLRERTGFSHGDLDQQLSSLLSALDVIHMPGAS